MGFFDVIKEILWTILIWVSYIVIIVGGVGAGLYLLINAFNPHSTVGHKRFL